MIKKESLNRLLYWSILVLFALLLLPPYFIQFPKIGIDRSWELALNMAVKNKMVFGRDFEWPYGPLGIYRSRMPVGTGRLFYFLFDVYFLATQLAVIRKVLKPRFNVATSLFIFLVIYISAWEEPGSWSLFLSVFYLLSILRGPFRWSWGIQATLMAVFTFYFKASVGIIAFFFFIGILCYTFIRRHLDAKTFALLLLLFIVCILGGAWVLRVDLKGYTIGGLHLISAYNDTMFLALSGYTGILFRIALVMAGGTIIFFIWQLAATLQKKKDPDDLVIYGIITLAVFFFYKSGFTRADFGHITQFFRGTVMFIGLLYYFGPAIRRWRITAAVWSWLVAGFTFVVFNLGVNAERTPSSIFTFSFFSDRAVNVRNYFTQLFGYDKIVGGQERRVAAANPFREVIGQGSTDIIPWEISTIYFNGLNYDPRPVIQSYSAYDRWLDSLNAAKYAAADGPQYVLFSFDATDQRFPWFDEARVKLELLNRYAYAGRIEQEMLLRRRPAPVLQETGQDMTTAGIGKDIIIPHYPGFRFSRFFIRYTAKGRFDRMLYQAPRLNIVVTLADGTGYSYRVSKPVLEDGLIINKYLDSQDEFQALLQGGGRMTPDVHSIRIESEDTASFEPEIRMTNTYYAFDPPPGQKAKDSTALAILFHQRIAEKINGSLLKPDTLVYSLELFRHDRWFTIAKGWAYRQKDDNTHDTLSAILFSADQVYELPTKRESSSDLVDGLGRKDISAIRFSAVMATCNLAPGHYELGIASRSPGDSIRRIMNTGQYLLVRENYKIERLPVEGAEAIAQSAHEKNSTLQWNIDKAEVQNHRITIEGWGLWPGVTKTKTSILLRDRTTLYRLSTDVVQRGDVADSRKDPSLQYCGFAIDLPTDSLPKGQYEMGIEIKSPSDGRKRAFSGRQISWE